MKHLVPCPECSRHVRVSETQCPFCALPLDLAGTPEPQLPRSRLGRAATFAFGATLVSATALAACSSDADDSSGSGGASSVAGSTSSAGAAGTGTSAAGSTSVGGTGSEMPVYGAPAAGSTSFGIAGSDGTAGRGEFPVYGAAP
ncbi:MAG TPA: hypothetical protein VK745_09445 [Polyangiaceae bacterium]|jgi:hypothetical protein|nr:hypothetical protein [Polyangiaceae bacterium]